MCNWPKNTTWKQKHNKWRRNILASVLQIETQISHVLTFLHIALQNGIVSEDERVKHSLAGCIKRAVQIDVTECFGSWILTVNVKVQPGNQQV